MSRFVVDTHALEVLLTYAADWECNIYVQPGRDFYDYLGISLYWDV